jgi:putative glycerol-1-phosphate prenyltransferase
MNCALPEIFSSDRSVAILVDPEKVVNEEKLIELVKRASFAKVSCFFIGGSTVSSTQFIDAVRIIRSHTTLPLYIFPGSSDQLSKDVDGLLYLSLLSGRNPEYLIGQHVKAATYIEALQIPVFPTAYLLIDGGTKSSVAYVSQTQPIPQDQTAIAYSTALAGKQLGFQLIYLDAGSGAKDPVPVEMIASIRSIGLPLIVGGGIRTVDGIRSAHEAGANVVVIGNKLEEDVDFLLDLSFYLALGTRL